MASREVQICVTATSNIDDLELTFQWKKDGINIKDSPRRVSGARFEVLTITDVQKSDEGFYCCVVSTPRNRCRAAKNTTSKATRLGPCKYLYLVCLI